MNSNRAAIAAPTESTTATHADADKDTRAESSVIAIPATATNSKRDVRRSSRDQTAVNIKTPSHRTAGQQKSEPCGTTVSQWSRHRPRRSDQPRVSKYPVLTIGRSGALAAPAGYSPLAASVGYGRSQVKRPCGLGRREERTGMLRRQRLEVLRRSWLAETKAITHPTKVSAKSTIREGTRRYAENSLDAPNRIVTLIWTRRCGPAASLTPVITAS